MVHALKEGWRVLVPGGYLIDLRPRATDWPARTLTDDRNEYDVRRSPTWAMVTCNVPATEPAKPDRLAPAATGWPIVPESATVWAGSPFTHTCG